MADVWANSMACHPRATCHIAGCCHLANSVSWSQSYVSHCRVLPPGEFNGMSSHSHVSHCRVLLLGEFTVTTCHIARCSHLAKSMSWSCHTAGCNNSIRHIENRFSPYFILFWFFYCSVGFDEQRLSYRLRYTCCVGNTGILLFSAAYICKSYLTPKIWNGLLIDIRLSHTISTNHVKR